MSPICAWWTTRVVPGELDLEYMGGSNADLAAASHMLTSPVVGCAGAEEDGLPF